MINWKYIFPLIFLLLLSLSCRSRLRPALYIIDGETDRKLNIDDCYYLSNFTLNSGLVLDPLKQGDGTVLITNRSIKNPETKIIETGIIKSYEQIHYRLYIDLPWDIKVDSLDLKNSSICRIIGMFEKEAKYRHFDCHEGYIVIDTVKSDRFFARMYGKYYNFENDSLIFSGSLNVKQRK